MDEEHYSETGKRPDNESTKQGGAMDEAGNAGQTDAGGGGSAYQPGQQPTRADQPEDQTEEGANTDQPGEGGKGASGYQSDQGEKTAGGSTSRPPGEDL